MKPSVQQALSLRPVPAGQELDTINNEIRPVLDGCRTAVNAESIFRVSVSSSDSPSAYKRLWESEAVPNSGTWMVEARAVGVDTAGAGVAYVKVAAFQMLAGVPTQVGADTSLVSLESTATPNARFGADLTANTVYVEAIDNGVAMAWVLVVKVLEAV